MPHVEIEIYDGDDTVYFTSEKADSLDPQDLQDALTAAFQAIEQDIWYADECETPEDEEPEEPCGWDDCCAEPFDPEPIGVGFLGEVVDMAPFAELGTIVNQNINAGLNFVIDIFGRPSIAFGNQPAFRLRDESSGYDRDDLLPEFSD